MPKLGLAMCKANAPPVVLLLQPLVHISNGKGNVFKLSQAEKSGPAALLV